jgi:hypothetical protein
MRWEDKKLINVLEVTILYGNNLKDEVKVKYYFYFADDESEA